MKDSYLIDIINNTTNVSELMNEGIAINILIHNETIKKGYVVRKKDNEVLCVKHMTFQEANEEWKETKECL